MLAYGNILQGHKENCLLLPGTSRSVKLCLLLTEGERDISSASCFDWSRIGDHVRLRVWDCFWEPSGHMVLSFEGSGLILRAEPSPLFSSTFTGSWALDGQMQMKPG